MRELGEAITLCFIVGVCAVSAAAPTRDDAQLDPWDDAFESAIDELRQSSRADGDSTLALVRHAREVMLRDRAAGLSRNEVTRLLPRATSAVVLESVAGTREPVRYVGIVEDSEGVHLWTNLRGNAVSGVVGGLAWEATKARLVAELPDCVSSVGRWSAGTVQFLSVQIAGGSKQFIVLGATDELLKPVFRKYPAHIGPQGRFIDALVSLAESVIDASEAGQPKCRGGSGE